MKRLLRQQIRELKGQHNAEERQALSLTLCLKVMAMQEWQTAETVLLYHPLPDEVDVRPLIDKAYEDGKVVLLPVCQGDDLVLRRYEGPESLRQGAFGIMEPESLLAQCEGWNGELLAIIPGMAFDPKGHRLGRGRGYYDRLLPRLPHARLLGICFPWQLLPDIPTEPHDFSMHDIIY